MDQVDQYQIDETKQLDQVYTMAALPFLSNTVQLLSRTVETKRQPFFLEHRLSTSLNYCHVR
jgi:hypothetical protein